MNVVRILWPSALIALCGPWPAYAATPSFDCTKAESSVESLVCADEELAKLDREIAQLFVLARRGPHMTPERQAELIGTQRGWIKGRNDCWKEPDVRICALFNYAVRIHELRDGFADTRTRDSDGISKGPVSEMCPNFDSRISATFIQTELPMVYLTWQNMSYVLMLGPSGSGARYVGKDSSNREIVFWDKGREALLELPGRSQLTCQVREPG